MLRSPQALAARIRHLFRWAALVVLPTLAFLPGLTSPRTHFDDALYLNRADLRREGLNGLARLWSGTSAWNGEFLELFPLRDTVYWFIFQRWQMSEVPYHLVSAGLHVLATIVLFALLLKCVASPWAAWAGALLFAVHPIHIESVVWIAGLKDPLYSVLMFASLWMFCSYRESRRPMQYAAALVFLVLALWSKSMALATPLLMVAIERLVGTPTPWKLVIRRVAGPAAICALFLTQFVMIGRLNLISNGPHQGSWLAHWVLSAWAQVGYVRQAFYPASFRLIYCFEPVNSLVDLRLLAALGLLVVIAVALIVWRKQPLRIFCIAFYFACLSPVSNLIPFPAVMADRYLYAASAGACLLIALLLDARRAILKNTVLGLVVVALTATTAFRSAVWRHEEALWEEADEDPVCLTDPEFPAAEVHFLRYLAASEDATRLAALQRILQTRGPNGDSFGRRCFALLNGAQLFERNRQPALAEAWLKEALPGCRAHPLLWPTALTLTAHRNLAAASDAAQKWSRWEPTPVPSLFALLTRLELQDTPDARAGLLALVTEQAAAVCPTLSRWQLELHPSKRESVVAALNACVLALPQ